MFAKRFFYVCAGLLCLAIAYHLGARSAAAQSGSPVSGLTVTNVGCGGAVYVLTPNGDLYARGLTCNGMTGSVPAFQGNFWSGATPTTQETFGSVKARYRGERRK